MIDSIKTIAPIVTDKEALELTRFISKIESEAQDRAYENARKIHTPSFKAYEFQS